jgi:YNFM family putative membrane transporter
VALVAEEQEQWVGGMVGFLLGAAGMFAVTYSTQPILPELSADFDVSPSRAGLTVSIVVFSLAVGAWLWGPFSDRVGRRRSIVLSSVLVVPPTVGAAVAPTFAALLAFRALQGLCMPGLLAAAVPYVAEAFAPRIGGRAMGYYVTALVAGGLIGRLGVGLVTAASTWRIALGLLALLPFAAAIAMARSLVESPTRPTTRRRAAAALHQLRNLRLLRAAAVGTAFFFTFAGTFSYVVYRLERPPFGLGQAAVSAIFVLWLLGAAAPIVGRIADRVGWRLLAAGATTLAAAGLLLTLPDTFPTVIAGLACIALANFVGVTAAQLGVVAASDEDRGSASAVYFSIYYGVGSLGAYLPGLAWETWRWHGVVATGLGALAVAGLALVVRRPREA